MARPPVLVVTNMWPGAADPSFGSFVAEQVSALRAMGLPVAVCFIDGRAGRSNYLWGIHRIRRWLRRGLPAPQLGEPARPFALVHAHYVLSGLAALLAGARRPRRPLLVTHHGIEVFEGWQAPLARLVSRLADRSLVISPAMAAHLGLDATAVLPCGIDLERFRPRDRDAACRELGLDAARRRIVWVGADRPEKRLALAREAAALVAARRPDVDLHVVSGLPPTAVPAHLAAGDVLLVSSTREGGPLVVKEALAMQLPVVSTAVGDVAALLEGLPGCALLGPAEERDLAAGLARALDQALGRRPGPMARERVRPYGQERIAARLLEVYDGLVRGAAGQTKGEGEG
jgi:glycosyltransferase involved in cell wall biosynthesis